MKPLPHNREAEAAVLAGVLLRNAALDDLSDQVNEDSFYVPAYKAVWRAMVKLSKRGEPIDPVTLEHQLRATDEIGLVGGLEGIGKLGDRYASTYHVAHHAKRVADMALQRRMLTAALQILDEGYEPKEDVGAWIDESQRRVMEMSAGTQVKTYAHISQYLHVEFEAAARQAVDSKRALEEGRTIPLRGLRTGYIRLDDMTGGLQPADLVVLAARPSMGKTAFAMNIAQNIAADGEPVMVFSMEMSAGQLTKREMFSASRINAKKFLRGDVLEGDMIALVNGCDKVNKYPICIDDRGGLSIREVRSVARRWRKDPAFFPKATTASGEEPKDKGPTGLIVVDYLQLGVGEDDTENRNLEIAQISRGLKGMAKELGLPVLALSQLNRGVDARPNKRPMMSDLRESGAIEQDADVIMFIYRRAVYMNDDDPEKVLAERDAEIIVGKQRNGEIGNFHLVFMGEHTRFENPDYHR